MPDLPIPSSDPLPARVTAPPAPAFKTASPPAGHRGLTFGPFLFYTESGQLVGPNGEIQLGPQALALLTILLENPGTLIPKREIFLRIWPAADVAESNLRVQVGRLRSALGDDPYSPRFVHTTAGLGYRFIAPVTEQGVEFAPDAAPRSGPIGRGDVVRDLLDCLPEQRLLTLVGPGGIGKTTVARELLVNAHRQTGIETAILELDALQDPSHITAAIASTFGLTSDAPTPASIAAAIRPRSILFLIDNCEHLIADVSKCIETLVHATTRLIIVATSREPLRVEGERVYRLPPLDFPTSTSPLSSNEAIQYPAVELFVVRSMERDPKFAFNDEVTPHISRICSHLDGVPLAIELAAARVNAFAPEALANRLEDRLALLNMNRQSAYARHQTLLATLDWSHDLLSGSEQLALRRLSVFPGEFCLPSALALLQPDMAGQMALDSVAELVAKSLLVSTSRPGQPRYKLLQTTRAYALSKLEAAGEVQSSLRSMASFTATHLLTALSAWETMETSAWLEAHAWRLGMIRASLDWSLGDGGDLQAALALTENSAPFWFALSLASDYRRYLETVLGHAEIPLPSIRRIKLQITLASAIFNISGPAPEVRDIAENALQQARSLGSPELELRALYRLARERYSRGLYQEAVGFVEQFGATARRHDNSGSLPIYHRMLSVGLHALGDHQAARQHAERALQDRPSAGQSMHKGLYEYEHNVAAHAHYARILWVLGLPADAARSAADGVQHALRSASAAHVCSALANSACLVAFWNGDQAAQETYVSMMEIYAEKMLSSHWRQLGRAYRGIIDLKSMTDANEIATTLAEIHRHCANSHQLDTLVTMEPRLVTTAAVSRATAGNSPWSAPEVLRAYGLQLLVTSGRAAHYQVESVFENALALARSQSAIGWETRIVTEQALLRDARGDRPGAVALLTDALARVSRDHQIPDIARASRALSAMSDGVAPEVRR